MKVWEFLKRAGMMILMGLAILVVWLLYPLLRWMESRDRRKFRQSPRKQR